MRHLHSMTHSTLPLYLPSPILAANGCSKSAAPGSGPVSFKTSRATSAPQARLHPAGDLSAFQTNRAEVGQRR